MELSKLSSDVSYNIRLQKILNSDYISVVNIRQRCQDSSLQEPMLISLDGRVLNISDCAMDTIDKINFHKRPITRLVFHENIALVGSILTAFVILAGSIYNNI